MTKAIALFLPQFHEIEENNKWWGEGFTEWTNLKKAKKLYNKHDFLIPLNDNYYNLLEKNVVEWQTNLANENGIYGFSYYHYWFCGKKILEKPAENLLRWKDINQKFMFLWANHDWSKSWIGKDSELLIKQEYGNINHWEQHFNYLLQFFLDDRYIKIDNKPVFQVYIVDDIPCFEEMVNFWNKKCIENGFDGIYIIEVVRDHLKLFQNSYSKISNAISIQEHTTTSKYWRSKYKFSVILQKFKKFIFGNKIDALETYDIIVEKSIEMIKNANPNIKTFFGVTTGWDNTPRYGERGYRIQGSNPTIFKKYLQDVKQISDNKQQEFIFISCWNEWCEGMCLEPSVQNNHDYLKSVKEVFKS